MFLTIALIVKNEIKHIHKCMESLCELRKHMDFQLIITDTGSDDGTDTAAEKYADVFQRFEWCDDFSAARNESLKAAEGKWYMFLDADEYLCEPEKLAAFFNSGEYKKYRSAAYIQRNYYSEEGGGYADAYIGRMTRIFPETCFKGRVHESLYPLYEPMKMLGFHVDHYGYVRENGVNKDKSRRNLKLLMLEYESGNVTDTLITQIADGFMNLGEFERCTAFCEENTDKVSGIYRYILLARRVTGHIMLKEYDAALSAAAAYSDGHKEQGLDLEIYYNKGVCLYSLGRDRECAETFAEYAQLYERLNSDREKYAASEYEQLYSDKPSLARAAAMSYEAACREYMSGERNYKRLYDCMKAAAQVSSLLGEGQAMGAAYYIYAYSCAVNKSRDFVGALRMFAASAPQFAAEAKELLGFAKSVMGQ